MERKRHEPMRKLTIKRIEQDLKQSELAEKAGISTRAVSAYERGVVFPTYKILVRLAKALKCSIDDLVEQEEAAESNEISLSELRKAVMPLVELLRRKGHCHMTAVVTGRNVILTEASKVLSLERND